MKIRSDINTDLLDQAEQELFDIIFQQRQAFNLRWRSNWVYRKGIPVLRAAGIALSVLGFTLCVYLLPQTAVWTPAHFQLMALLLVFVLFFMLFYFLPPLNQHLQQKLEKWLIRSCKKQAAKCVKAARSCVPYTAEYEIKDKQIYYYRNRENKTELVWSRHLNGVAFHRKRATIIYRKPTSFMPKIIILHAEFESLADALKEQGVEILPWP